ncbi:MAG: hypothetical protein B7X04_02985 [Parcubacteria group bacterium 21-54-25]|nr:MAG: hypothetical protein B7X04_02985 [Parcubacteria group bacterium 21-54-25]HQU07920.1 class I SAM-dependent methyltransferase [Candidatus Paceibacterota bacterium]
MQAYDEETAGFWNTFPRSFLDMFIASSGMRVLDIGSGPGRDGLLLQAAGKQVVCIDAASEMVRCSAARGLDSLIGDFSALPFANGSFDATWAYTSLLHVPKNTLATPIAEMRRILRPDGIVGLGLIEGSAESYRENMKGVSGVFPRWFSYYQKEEVEEIMHRHGFVLQYFESITPGPRSYLHFIFKKDA